jgi:hypothetical protein
VASAAEGGGAGNFGIRQGDSTFALIRQNAAAMRKRASVMANFSSHRHSSALSRQCHVQHQTGAPSCCAFCLSEPAFCTVKRGVPCRSLSAHIPGCTAAPASVPPANDCSATWVAGRPGTG